MSETNGFRVDEVKKQRPAKCIWKITLSELRLFGQVSQTTHLRHTPQLCSVRHNVYYFALRQCFRLSMCSLVMYFRPIHTIWKESWKDCFYTAPTEPPNPSQPYSWFVTSSFRGLPKSGVHFIWTYRQASYKPDEDDSFNLKQSFFVHFQGPCGSCEKFLPCKRGSSPYLYTNR